MVELLLTIIIILVLLIVSLMLAIGLAESSKNSWQNMFKIADKTINELNENYDGYKILVNEQFDILNRQIKLQKELLDYYEQDRNC